VSPPLRLVVTTGDPRGIGPEVAKAALLRLREERPAVSVSLFGTVLDGTPGDRRSEAVPFDGSEASAGRIARCAVEEAVAMLKAGQADALVTGPIHKPAFRAAGVAEPGHTEFLQRLTGVPDVGMLMAAEATRLGGPLRVLLATTHVALRDVPSALTAELLIRQVTLLDRALRCWWGFQAPRIALCAFNPHASDGGLFGDEEERVMRPALAECQRRGIAATGPFPADTIFSRALSGSFDAVVAPYHDVGMAAFKTASFGGGVNVTLGLPFPRTSPDHGTAFDIAGTGTANASSMFEALDLAVKLAHTAAPL
jgi:4-hydroxythreonine-4-phosphate dehydrogenase